MLLYTVEYEYNFWMLLTGTAENRHVETILTRIFGTLCADVRIIDYVVKLTVHRNAASGGPIKA